MNATGRGVWMTMKEVTAVLEVSKRTVPKLVESGAIRRRDTSAHKRYLRSDVEALIASQQTIRA
jgi:excisionase family DNA binding protein